MTSLADIPQNPECGRVKGTLGCLNFVAPDPNTNPCWNCPWWDAFCPDEDDDERYAMIDGEWVSYVDYYGALDYVMDRLCGDADTKFLGNVVSPFLDAIEYESWEVSHFLPSTLEDTQCTL